MSPFDSPSRRRFLGSSLAVAAAARMATPARAAVAEEKPYLPIYKTLKWGMIGVPGNVTDKFRAAKEAGFDGVELDSPGVDVKAVREAIDATGLPVDGTVCSTHWGIRHSSPDAGTRAQALQDLETAIRQTHAVGGHTVLLVVGKGEDGPENEIWPRSIENIRKALPLAGQLGIYIAIENVWNQFLYDHGGPSNQSAEKYAKYVDEFDSPWVGMQFDLGNHWKYGDVAEWVRTLGKRIVKLDIKGFSRAKDGFTPNVTGGDIDWASVRSALREIGFTGWCAAEVSGGDLKHLTQIAKEIDEAMGIPAKS